MNLNSFSLFLSLQFDQIFDIQDFIGFKMCSVTVLSTNVKLQNVILLHKNNIGTNERNCF